MSVVPPLYSGQSWLISVKELGLAISLTCPFFICLGGYNKIPYTEGLGSDKNLILTAWRLGSPKSRCGQIWCWVKAPFRVWRWLSSRSLPKAERQGSSLGCLLEETHPIHEGSALMTSSPPQSSHLLIPSHRG